MATSSTRSYSQGPKAPEPQVQVIEHRYTRAARPKTPKGVRFARGTKRVSNIASGDIGSSNVQGIIVTSALVTFALAYLNSYLVPRKTPRVRLFIGVAILYIGLSIIAQFNAKIARGFAILIMFTALLAEGGGVLNWLMGRGTHDHIGLSSTGTPNLPPVGRKPVPQLPPPNPANLQNTLPNLNVPQTLYRSH